MKTLLTAKTTNTEILEARFRIALAQPLTVLAVSSTVDDLLGYKQDDFVSGKRSLQSLIHPHDQDIAEALFSSETQSTPTNFNIRLRHADGRIRCIKGQYSKVIDPATNSMTLELLLQDAKSLWQQQDDQTMMADFKVIMDNTYDYIYFKDCNHVFTGASENLVAITDSSERGADLIGKTVYDVFPEDYADVDYRLEKQVLAGIQVAHQEQEIVDNEGHKGWVDNRKYPLKNDAGERIGLFGVARDITEKKLAEDALVSAETKFHTLFNTMGDAVMMLDERGFLECNPAALDLFGLNSQENLRQYHPADLSPPTQACGTDSVTLANHYINTALKDGTARFEWIYKRADTGKSSIADVLLTSLTLDGRLVLQATARDITERKKAERCEQARRAVLEALTQEQSLATILQFLVQSIEQENPAMLCSILLLDTEGKHLLLGAAGPNLPEFYNQAIQGIEIGEGVGSCGSAAFLKKRVIVDDIQTHLYWQPYKEFAAKAKLSACWSEPIISSEGDVLGTFAIYHREKKSPNEDDFKLMGYAAQLATIAIERHRSNEKQKLAARVFNSSLEGIIITNAQKEIIDVNPAFSDITGYSREDVIGQNPKILSSGRQSPEFYQAMWQEINAQGYWQGEVWNRTKAGEIYAELLSISALKNEQGDVSHYVGLFSDTTHSKQQQEQLSQMAHYDMLTGLPNRTLFADRFTQSLAHSKRNKSLLAVCFLDLDNFKPVNDNYGHEVGDQLLIEVARRIQDHIREEDTASRQGGDEFTLLLNDIESYDQCEMTLERILHVLAKPYLINGTSHIITVSIGVTLYPDDNADIDTLIRHADNAMYQAKQSGRNRYHIFDSQHDKQLVQKQHRLEEIQQALINNELSLYYQPKVNMVTGKVFGAEALIRWHHPEKGLIPPLDFLPMIDGTDLELQIGDWVINQALQQMTNWLSQDIKLEVSVNIASHHLQSDTFFANLEAALAHYPAVDSNDLQLEILESSVLSDLNTISHIIDTCQSALGVNIALDDFGTGYSSLTHLRHLSANTIKIDQSFVRDILDDPDDYNIVDGVIGLAEAFGRDVIAEGVETTAHGLMLQVMGCKAAQGYGIAKPMPADDFCTWLSDYQPNQQWLDCGKQVRSIKEDKLKLFRLLSGHWLAFFVSNIQSLPQDIKHWPTMNGKHDPSGQWIEHKRKAELFTSESLDRLDKAHEHFHSVAQAIHHQYQQGDIDAARAALPELQSAFDEMSNAVGLLE